MLEFPEAAAHKSLLTRLSLAEEQVSKTEAELHHAQAHVDQIEDKLRVALGVQNDA